MRILPCREVHLPPKCDKTHYWDEENREMIHVKEKPAKAVFTTNSHIVNPGEID